MEIYIHTNKTNQPKMNSKAALSRKNTAEDLNIIQNQTILRSHGVKDSMVLTQTLTHSRQLMGDHR